MHWASLSLLTLDGYTRRLDADESLLIRADVPSDIGELLRVVLDVEATEHPTSIDAVFAGL